LVQLETRLVAEAVETIETAIRGRDLDEADPDLATAAAVLGRAYMNMGHHEQGFAWSDRAIALAERADSRKPLLDALITRAWAASALGRGREALAIAWGSLQLARRWGFVEEELRVRNNLGGLEADPALLRDLWTEGLEVAQRHGRRMWVEIMEAGLLFLRLLDGDWDRVLAEVESDEQMDVAARGERNGIAANIFTYRGEFERAQAYVDVLERLSAGTSKANDIAGTQITAALLRLAEGQYEEAWRLGAAAGSVSPETHYGWLLAGLAAFRLRDADRLGRAAGAIATEGADDFRLAVRLTARGYDALLAGRRAEAATELRESRELWRRLRDITNEPFAAAALVAAVGVDSTEGRAIADDLRARLRQLRAEWLLRWLDEVVAEAGPAGQAEPVERPAQPDIGVRSGGR
jgi:tetratricopeptide (TPR) repeat protein